MKKPDLTKLRKKISGKGVYIAAAACILAVGGVGAATYNSAVNKINDGISNTAPRITETRREGTYADEKKTDVPKTDTPLPESKPDESINEPASEPDSSTTEQPLITQPNIMPVNGEIIEPFSFGELVKSTTLDVWKTHDGIDIKADNGTPVKAMNRGEVIKIWDDPLWGNCVSIDHGKGIVSYYYNLSASMTVEEGDQVDSGQIIGSVGDTAQIEAAEPSHLHFAIKQNGEWIDPVGYIDPISNK